jgi:hypothetical protein
MIDRTCHRIIVTAHRWRASRRGQATDSGPITTTAAGSAHRARHSFETWNCSLIFAPAVPLRNTERTIASVSPRWKVPLGTAQELVSLHAPPLLSTESHLSQIERPLVCFVSAIPTSKGGDALPY